MHHHAVPLAEVPGLGGEGPEPHDVEGYVFEVVAEGQICRTGASCIDLDDLPFNPGPGPACHCIVVLLTEYADRPRVLLGGVPCQPGQLVQRFGGQAARPG